MWWKYCQSPNPVANGERNAGLHIAPAATTAQGPTRHNCEAVGESGVGLIGERYNTEIAAFTIVGDGRRDGRDPIRARSRASARLGNDLTRSAHGRHGQG